MLTLSNRFGLATAMTVRQLKLWPLLRPTLEGHTKWAMTFDNPESRN